MPGASLGIIPGGRGNDLARVLRIPQDAIAACGTGPVASVTVAPGHDVRCLRVRELLASELVTR